MTVEQMGGVGAVLTDELRRAADRGARARAAVLVEGVSDQRAIEALARRRGRDLDAERILIIPMAGATNLPRFLDVLGPGGHDVPLGGLCDAAEEHGFIRALQDAEVGVDLDRDRLERIGFFVCEPDLEEELVRALGAERMIRLIESQGQIRRFRSFQKQPAQRHKELTAQICRWLGNHKIRYAPLMVDALDRNAVPRALDRVLPPVTS